jgi:putative endonuclease
VSFRLHNPTISSHLFASEFLGGRIAENPRVARSRCFVYVIQSINDRTRYYTGLTSDVTERLAAHNAGGCAHTATATPWERVVTIEFADERRAIAFEKYLKSGSGVAFSKRHLR